MAGPFTALDLANYILRANPYKLNPGDPAPANVELMLDEVEKDGYEGEGVFKKTPHRVVRTIRVPYCYTDQDGQTVTDYLLIGYEGGPGGN